jgi:hypothetical protein
MRKKSDINYIPRCLDKGSVTKEGAPYYPESLDRESAKYLRTTAAAYLKGNATVAELDRAVSDWQQIRRGMETEKGNR